LFGDALDAPDAGGEERRFRPSNGPKSRTDHVPNPFSIARVANDRHRVLVERDVDVVRGGAT